MPERIPETDATFIPDPLSDDELDRVSGGTIDRTHPTVDDTQIKLQEAMQRENQVFSSVASVLATQDGTNKNSIGNIK